MDGNKKDIQLSLGDNDSNQCLFIFNKTEKIVHASYVVTNLLPTQEPMRWNIREECHYLLRHALPLKDIQDMVRMKEFVEKIQTSIFSLLSLYEISARSQILSQMNCDVIRDELINLSKEVRSLCDVHQTTYGFHQDELSLGSKYASLIFNSGEPDGMSLIDKGQETGGGKGQDIKDNSYKGQEIKDIANRTKSKGHVLNKKDITDRRKKIIDLIKAKKEVSIKDLAKDIKGCSEKTIQRELSAMVSDGILVKEGERRWSTYKLK